MKHKEDTHRDFIPLRVVNQATTSKIKGVIMEVEFKKINNLTLWQSILDALYITLHKTIYFWLPYKTLVKGHNKYSVIGGRGRDPYAKQWFEIKEDTDIYELGLKEFIFHQNKRKAFCLLPFMPEEMLTLTRKKVIKMLDENLFKGKQTTIKK